MPRFSISILTLLLITLVNTYALAQSYDGEGYLKKSEELLEKNEVGKAKNLILKALNTYSENDLALCLLGLAYLKENNYQEAANSFEKAYSINKNLSSKNMLLYANALKQNGDYIKSEQIFNSVLDKNNYTSEQRRQIQNAITGINEVKNGSITSYENGLKAITANSSGSEIAPYPNSSVGFTFGQTIKSENGLAVDNYINTGENQEKIEINANLGLLTNLQIIDDQVFFNLCNAGICKIYSGKIDKKNKIKNIEEINQVNNEGYSSTQAFVFKQKGSLVMLYSSNKPDGQGGYDIYLSVKTNKGWTESKPLPKSINSPGDEVTPFFDGNYLYFASNYFPGLGGFDIFRSKSNNFIGFGKIENLGTPFNSVANDLYFKLNPTNNNGFLSSNRVGSVVGSSTTCCNDIYEFPWPPKLIEPSKANPEKDDDKSKYSNLLAELKSTLPLTLYFHNDIPLANIKVPTYTETYFPYKAMENEYLNSNYSSESKNFFRNTLALEYSKLQSFTVLIQELLKSDVKIEFTVKGFASPLATTSYNQALSQRRIQSFINELFAFKAGLFSAYRDNISIKQLPFGEEKSNKSVSDDRKDPKNSIYAFGATQERKIEIVNIEEETETKQSSVALYDKKSNADTLTFEVEQRASADTAIMRFGTRTDSITVRNPYNEKFNIATIEPSCGCTTASIKQNYIEANGTIIMVAERDVINGKVKPVTVTFISAEPQERPNFVIPLD